jgi:hypothetical protein
MHNKCCIAKEVCNITTLLKYLNFFRYGYITITPLDNEHLKVEYELGRNCKSINLLSPYQERTQDLRREWKVIDRCGDISAVGVLTKNTNCNTIRLSIPILATNLDRIYPTAYPFSTEGVFVHTGALAVDNSCGEIRWNFLSSNGNVVIEGENKGGSATVTQAQNSFIKYTGVYFSYSQLNTKNVKVVTRDVPEWLKDGIINAGAEIQQYYLKTFPRLDFTLPALFVDNIKNQSRPSSQADVSSHRMVRFGFVNYSDSDFESNIDNIKGLVAHEYAHILQPKQFSKNNEPFISEGGAEFIRWITAYHLGWADKKSLESDFTRNLSVCLKTLENFTWYDLPPSSRGLHSFPYACGFSLHVIALASRKNVESAEDTLGNYYVDYEKNHARNFSHALECGKIIQCKEKWLPSLLNEKEKAVDIISNQLYSLGLVKNRTNIPNLNHLVSLSQIMFSQLMKGDCNNSIDFWTNADHFLTGDMSRCKSFKNNLKITSVEGVSYFSAPEKAVYVQRRACIEKHEVMLGTADGKSLTIPCSIQSEPPYIYFQIDIEKLLLLLETK